MQQYKTELSEQMQTKTFDALRDVWGRLLDLGDMFGEFWGHVWQIFRGMWEVWGAGVYNEKAYKTYMILHMNLHINSNPY